MKAFSCPAAKRTANVRAVTAGAQGAGHSSRSDALSAVAVAGVVAAALHLAPVANAETRLPPIDRDPNRCDRGYTGNTIGQANAVSDKALDLRQCNYKGANLSAKVLSGAFMSDADFSNANMREAVMTKAYAVNSKFDAADMTNAVIDRVDFRKASMRGVKFSNAVITGAFFDGADLTDTDFEDALIGGEDAKRLCLNPTLKGESRAGVGCRAQK